MKFLNLLTVCLIALIPFSAEGQTSHIVDVTNNKFTPVEITINAGDTVIWTNSEGNHNVNGTQGTFPGNAESFGNDVAVGWVFSHVFTIAGTYDYQCDPHVRSQMFGKVIVEEQLSAGPNVVLAEDAALGSILSDGLGFTLYYFTLDRDPETSLCTEGCLDNWPLFYEDTLVLGDGLNMDDFGTIEHPSGVNQTTYMGWPLYYWVNDLNPGETGGEALNNKWFVAKPDYSIMLMDGLLLGKDGVTYNSVYEPGEEMVQYFVDSKGRTLYIFINDGYDQNNFTSEDFSNNSTWPIYEKDLMRVASTLDESMFGSIDVFGHSQLTYNGWPIYYFGGDTERGQTMGVSVPSPGIWPVAVQGLEAPIVSAVEDARMSASLELYPNPAMGELNITSDEEIESISIFDIRGAQISSYTNIPSRQALINLEDVTPGIYLVELKTVDNRALFSRFIKK